MPLNPKIFTWARETAGLTLEQAAQSIELGAARGKAGDERLAAIEAGDEAPSRPLLLRMAKAYRRPLLVFYLAAPPRTGNRTLTASRTKVAFSTRYCAISMRDKALCGHFEKISKPRTCGSSNRFLRRCRPPRWRNASRRRSDST